MLLVACPLDLKMVPRTCKMTITVSKTLQPPLKNFRKPETDMRIASSMTKMRQKSN